MTRFSFSNENHTREIYYLNNKKLHQKWLMNAASCASLELTKREAWKNLCKHDVFGHMKGSCLLNSGVLIDAQAATAWTK